MRRLFAALLILCLLLAGLLVWQLWPRPVNPLAVRAEELSGVTLTALTGHWHTDEVVRQLDAPEEIAAFCRLWNRTWMTQILPYYHYERWSAGEPLSGGSPTVRVLLTFRDGTTRHYQASHMFVKDLNAAPQDAFYTCVAVELSSRLEDWVLEPETLDELLK